MIQKKQIPPELLDVGESFEQKYVPVLDFDGWRVAMLRHNELTDKSSFRRFEKHNETHEVFILTMGKSYLLLADNGATPDNFYILSMKHNVAYNVRPSVWHTVVMSEDAHIILFEKTNTSRSNSDYHQLNDEVISEMQKYFTEL